MGTPEFAVGVLKRLVQESYNIVAAITATDKPAGRGQKLTYSAVKEYALSQNIPVLQPANLKDEKFLTELASFKADIHIVVAFRMLPKVVWNMPTHGTFNLHASLLPQYRGAAPINWAIVNGETETGVTTFFIEEEIDTGNILMRETVAILPEDNAGTLHDKLMETGAQLVQRTVDMIISGTYKAIPQTELKQAELRAAPKLSKETCRIDWQKDANSIHNVVRGFSPYPAAWTMLHIETQEILVKIFATTYSIKNHDKQSGTIICDSKHSLKVATTDGYISILELQVPGKKKMDIVSFLNGNQISEKDHFQ